MPAALRTLAITFAAPLPLGAAQAGSAPAVLPISATIQSSCVVSSGAARGAALPTVSCSSAKPISISIDRPPAADSGQATTQPAGVTRITVTY